jgi:hypothetical protein
MHLKCIGDEQKKYQDVPGYEQPMEMIMIKAV